MSKPESEKPRDTESHAYNWKQRAGLLRGPAPKPPEKDSK